MNRIVIIACLLITGSSLFAQDTEMEMLRSYFSMERKVAIAEFMDLSGPEELLFWNIYDQYEVSRKLLADERIQLLQNYGKNFSSITDEKAQEWINSSISRKTSEIKLQKKYLKQISKEISPMVALKFGQIDSYISAIVELQLLENLPFVGEDLER